MDISVGVCSNSVCSAGVLADPTVPVRGRVRGAGSCAGAGVRALLGARAGRRAPSGRHRCRLGAHWTLAAHGRYTLYF